MQMFQGPLGGMMWIGMVFWSVVGLFMLGLAITIIVRGLAPVFKRWHRSFRFWRADMVQRFKYRFLPVRYW